MMKEIEDLSDKQQRNQNHLDLLKAKRAGTATYRPIIENPFTFVAQQPLSNTDLTLGFRELYQISAVTPPVPGS